MAVGKHTQPSKRRTSAPVVLDTRLENLVIAAQSGSDAYDWCETLFQQIKDNLSAGLRVSRDDTPETDARQCRHLAIRCETLAEIGAHLARFFGDELDAAREAAESLISGTSLHTDESEVAA